MVRAVIPFASCQHDGQNAKAWPACASLRWPSATVQARARVVLWSFIAKATDVAPAGRPRYESSAERRSSATNEGEVLRCYEV